jgi:hypothetical protein
MVDAKQDIQAAPIGGIGVEDVASRVVGEHAGSGSFLGWELGLRVVVGDLAGSHLVLREGNVMVAVEIVGER